MSWDRTKLFLFNSYLFVSGLLCCVEGHCKVADGLEKKNHNIFLTKTTPIFQAVLHSLAGPYFISYSYQLPIFLRLNFQFNISIIISSFTSFRCLFHILCLAEIHYVIFFNSTVRFSLMICFSHFKPGSVMFLFMVSPPNSSSIYLLIFCPLSQFSLQFGLLIFFSTFVCLIFLFIASISKSYIIVGFICVLHTLLS